MAQILVLMQPQNRELGRAVRIYLGHKNQYDAVDCADYAAAVTVMAEAPAQIAVIELARSNIFNGVDIAHLLAFYNPDLIIFFLETYDPDKRRFGVWLPRLRVTYMGMPLDIEELRIRIQMIVDSLQPGASYAKVSWLFEE